MLVRTLLFARYRELAGADHLTVELPSQATVRHLVQALRDGPLAQLPAEPAVAVNHSYVDLDTTLREGDEVALIPPVSGG